MAEHIEKIKIKSERKKKPAENNRRKTIRTGASPNEMNFKHSNTNETIIETQPYNQEKENERTELFTKSRRSFI